MTAAINVEDTRATFELRMEIGFQYRDCIMTVGPATAASSRDLQRKRFSLAQKLCLLLEAEAILLVLRVWFP